MLVRPPRYSSLRWILSSGGLSPLPVRTDHPSQIREPTEVFGRYRTGHGGPWNSNRYAVEDGKWRGSWCSPASVPLRLSDSTSNRETRKIPE